MADSPLSEKRLGLVGAGKMAEAIARGVIAAGVVEASRIVAGDPDASRRELFASLGIRAVEDNGEVLAAADIVVLAVKPQVMGEVLSDLRASARETHLLVSIAAGVTTARIEAALPDGARVVRVMPNTPMQVGCGASALAGGTHASEEDMAVARALCEASGIAVEVAEQHMDAVTAVSGSGPAYAFFLAECMIEAGVAEGLPPALARRLSAATIEGAGRLLSLGSEGPSELRRRVTSPGGTTQAAFAVLDDGGVRGRFVAAIRRAAARSRELSGS